MKIYRSRLFRNNWRSLNYFLESGINLSEKVEMEAVIQDTLNFIELLKYDILPSFEIQLIAVQKSGHILDHLIKYLYDNDIKYLYDNDICSFLSEEIVLEAIKQEGVVIRSLCHYNLHISSEMKIEAIKNSKRALKILLEYNIPITDEEQILLLSHNWKYIDVFDKYGLSNEAKQYANEQLLLLPLSMDNRILFYKIIEYHMHTLLNIVDVL